MLSFIYILKQNTRRMKTNTRCITLRHLILDSEKHIAFEYNADNAVNTLLNTFKDLKWSEQFNMSYINNNKENIQKIFSIFKGIAWINLKYFYKDKPINTSLPEQNFSKLKEILSDKDLRLAKPEELKEYFGAEPGCAYPFGFDESIKIYVDPTIYDQEWFLFSPLFATKTIQVRGSGLRRIFPNLKNKTVMNREIFI